MRRSMQPFPADREAPFAVVDIGSNSIRLVVYERLCRAPIALFNEKSVCALGKSIATTGRLGREEMDSTLHALRRFAHIAGALRVGEIEYVATEAVRSAANGAEFLAEAERAIGREVVVLSGHDEAHTAAMGVTYSFYRPDGVVGDLGGGSVDLSVVTPDGPTAPYGSLPIGTLPVTRMLLDRDVAAASVIDDRLAGVGWLAGAACRSQLLCGRWRLAGVGTGAAGHDRHALEGRARLPDHRGGGDHARSQHRGAGQGRATDGAGHARTADRDGARCGAAARAGRAASRARSGGVLSFWLARGARFRAAVVRGAGAGPAARGGRAISAVAARAYPRSAPPWVRWTASVAGEETEAQRRLRLAVCEVSDSAWREHPALRAREAFYRLAQYPFIGIDHAERAFLAYAVFIRYEGHPDDLFIRQILTLLPEPERRRAELLGATLQLGYRISAAVPELLATSRLRIAGEELRLDLPAPDAAPDPEILEAAPAGGREGAGSHAYSRGERQQARFRPGRRPSVRRPRQRLSRPRSGRLWWRSRGTRVDGSRPARSCGRVDP